MHTSIRLITSILLLCSSAFAAVDQNSTKVRPIQAEKKDHALDIPLAQGITPVLVAEGGTIHRFFDTDPISPSGKYIAVFRFPYEDHSPKPNDKGDVVVIDLATKKEVFSTKTQGWEFQLGAQVQWGSTDEDLFYNDVDPNTWEAFAVKVNFKTGEKKRLKGTVFMVSPDGKKFASFNLRNSRLAQVGYGVIIPTELVKANLGPVTDDGVYITDIETNTCKMIASIKDIFEKTVPSIKDYPSTKNPENLEFYVFQTKWNPQGTKIMISLQWSLPGQSHKRKRCVVTMNADGTDIRTAITQPQWSKGGHHINWMPDGEHISMNLNVDGKRGLEIASVKYDGSDLKQIFPVGSGHPSMHPHGLPFMITDAYSGEMPLKGGSTPIRFMNIETQKEIIAATVSLPPIENREFRIDAHPAWDRTGRYVIYNAAKDGKRCVYMIDVSSLLKK